MRWFLGLLMVMALATPSLAAKDALDEVNTWRAKRGLRPFKRHVALCRTAAKCADYRAARLIEGHPRQSMFPVYASEGCGAATDEWGWLSCCQDENWKYAGAAWTRGRDGQRYMTLHVTNQPPREVKEVKEGG